jgi:hypothetical protein
MMPKAYYFGCVARAGHYLFGANGEAIYHDERKAMALPWKDSEIDGKLAPQPRLQPALREQAQPEGQAVVHHREGWTALSFWDRSVDGRPGSNSTFFVEGTHEFPAMLQLVRELFPRIVKRFKFEIVEYHKREGKS